MARKEESLGEQYRRSLNCIKKDAFIQAVKERPETTLEELAEYREEFPRITLTELMGGSIAQARAESKKAPAKKRAKAPIKKWAKVPIDTRHPAGREALDDSVLELMRSEADRAWKASDLRSALGGTPTQIRASLARLIEFHQVAWQGQARGTTYHIQ